MVGVFNNIGAGVAMEVEINPPFKKVEARGKPIMVKGPEKEFELMRNRKLLDPIKIITLRHRVVF